MIKANELRIGNWVSLDLNHSDTSEFQIELADLNLIATDKNRNYNPITLSEEWLVKFGFEKIKKESYSTGKNVYFNVYKLGSLTYNTSQDIWWFGYLKLEPPPKYVHQLQNLYFALRGEELEIKNKK